MINKFRIAAMVVAVAWAAPSFAEDKCVLQITRTACPGKEKESFSKCDGKASCEVKDAAADEKACAAAAVKACENTPDRQKVTKAKVIKALFGGKPIEGGKNFCAVDRADFNKC